MKLQVRSQNAFKKSNKETIKLMKRTHISSQIKMAACLMLVLTGFQQGYAQQDTLIKRDLTLERAYQLELEKPERKLILPELEEADYTKREPVFSLTGTPALITGDYSPLPPPEIRSAFPAQKQFGYVRLGAGSRQAYSGDAQVMLLRKDNQTLDVRLMHRSIYGDIKNASETDVRAYTNQNLLQATYQYHFTPFDLTVKAWEAYNAWNYYGDWKTTTDPDLTSSSAIIAPEAQWSSNTAIQVGLQSKQLQQRFHWALQAKAQLFRLGKGLTHATYTPEKSRGGREREIDLLGNVTYDLSNTLHLGIDARLRQFRHRAAESFGVQALDFEDHSWFTLSPYANLTYRQWDIKAGLQVSVPSDNDEQLRYNLIAGGQTSLSDKAVFRIEAGGGIQPNSYQEGFMQNPYLNPAVRLEPTYIPFKLDGSIDFRPIRELRLTPLFEYEYTRNLPTFYNAAASGGWNDLFTDQAYGKVFEVAYLKTIRYTLGANALLVPSKWMSFTNTFRYNLFHSSSDDPAIEHYLNNNNRKTWHRPGIVYQAKMDIFPADRFQLFAGYRWEGLRFAPGRTGNVEALQSIKDLQLGGSWQATRDVTIFLQFNNLLDHRHEAWYGYKVHGFSAMLGGSVHF